MSYSLDLRQKVVSYLESGQSRVSAAAIFGIGESTVRRWILGIFAQTAKNLH